jgi:NAD(P)H-flavin reductase/ferredoxin
MQVPILLNGKEIRVRSGDTLVNAALTAGIVIPHDCLTGQCDTCLVTVLAGDVDSPSANHDGDVMACQARVKGPASFAYEEIPAVSKVKGEVLTATPMAADVWEVVVGVKKRVPYLPGQYVNVVFGSLPERALSPTLGLDTHADEFELIFHIRAMPGGQMSGQLGRKIVKGARVQVRGPFGHAYLRRGKGRLVFISSGTGFAPIWSMALAARLGQPERDMVVVTGARLRDRLYMAPALDWLRANGARRVVAAASNGDGVAVAVGRAADHIPQLFATDIVHVAGPVSLVETTLARARAVGAQCYTDPFERVELPKTFGARLTKLFSRFSTSRGEVATSTT